VATIVSVDGNEVQFLGWPITVQLGDDVLNTGGEDEDDKDDESENDEGETEDIEALSAGQVVQAIICLSENGQIVIVQIVNLEDDDDGDFSDEGEKVLVCHKPEKKKGGNTLSIGAPAVPAHLGHGDTLGPCP
jgi:hypothetical protein